ncbi:MAG: hypothetical protein KatS3mg031_1371 [Chitinophagales bacterium]|nr:MAG: hypothetical protein KatS3mg031_1371 [Chitinophagales bacterium]
MVLFLTFFGHGLASLGFSEASYNLHRQLFESVNFFNWNAEGFLVVQGWWDVLMAIALLSGIFPRIVLPMAIVYLLMVSGVAYVYYFTKSGSWWGLAEIGRRMAWILYAAFLYFHATAQVSRYSLLRVGISFGFLSHGITSLGYFGGRAGQLALAAQIFPQETAQTIIFFSGFSDLILGSMLFTGWGSRPAAIAGTLWLVAVVFLSFMMGIPDGIFRSGFLFSCLYVAMDNRCHTPLLNGVAQRKSVVLNPK